MSTPLFVGQQFNVRYPFCRETHWALGLDQQTWRPGLRYDNDAIGNTTGHADGIGMMTLAVVGIYKPWKYPERVFYKRSWTTPDGKTFGKTKLRVTTTIAFRLLASGYRYWDQCDYLAGEKFVGVEAAVDRSA